MGTGNLWPDFAMELGGGQNIWNFAYYGLYNPLHLLSFLLPFVKMSDYVQAVMVLTWIADGLLCYIWLKNGHFRREDSFLQPFSSCFQVLWYSILPCRPCLSAICFLLLTLIGYDRYVSTGKYSLLTAGVLLMVLTSFYFAVGGVAALLIYGLCGWKKEWASSPGSLSGLCGNSSILPSLGDFCHFSTWCRCVLPCWVEGAMTAAMRCRILLRRK